MNEFRNSGKKITISTEKTAWPYIETLREWAKRDLNDNEFSFLNSGFVLSEVKTFHSILCDLERICLETNIDFWDDQGVWQYYDLMKNNIDKDHKSLYCFSTALLDETYYEIKNGKLKTKFGTEPYVIHDNSSFSLNLTKKL
jgi:hypothetical protein